MKHTRFFTFFIIFLTLISISFAQQKLEYPKATKIDQIDDFHGIKVADPFRWLENPDARETTQWIEAQNKLTDAYFKTIPSRERIKTRLTELWNYEKIFCAIQKGETLFLFQK